MGKELSVERTEQCGDADGKVVGTREEREEHVCKDAPGRSGCSKRRVVLRLGSRKYEL